MPTLTLELPVVVNGKAHTFYLHREAKPQAFDKNESASLIQKKLQLDIRNLIGWSSKYRKEELYVSTETVTWVEGLENCMRILIHCSTEFHNIVYYWEDRGIDLLELFEEGKPLASLAIPKIFKHLSLREDNI